MKIFPSFHSYFVIIHMVMIYFSTRKQGNIMDTQKQNEVVEPTVERSVEQAIERRLEESTPKLPVLEHRKYTQVVYVLYLASLFTGITSIIGVIIAYVKRDEVRGTVDESHLQYLIRTFWFSLLGFIIGMILVLVLIGYLIILAVSVWFIYRVVMGFMRLLDNKPVDPYGWF